MLKSGFRPLSGSYISQQEMPPLRLKLSLFPSPIGELHFSIVRNTLGEIRFRVSVPYRGATFLNRNTNYNNRKELVISVPYRGATFLNRAWELVKKSAMTDFRPLSGSYISQSNVLSEYVKNVNFRPLSGSYISQQGARKSVKVPQVISVPYRGATFLNKVH